MVEEFISWVKNVKGDDGEPISFHDIDYELLLRFVLEKKLIDLDDLPEYIKEAQNEGEDDIDLKGLNRRALPRKIRRKT